MLQFSLDFWVARLKFRCQQSLLLDWLQEVGGGYVAPWEAIGLSTEAAWVRILVVFVARAGPLVQGFRAALLGPNKITSTNYTLHLVVIPVLQYKYGPKILTALYSIHLDRLPKNWKKHINHQTQSFVDSAKAYKFFKPLSRHLIDLGRF